MHRRPWSHSGGLLALALYVQSGCSGPSGQQLGLKESRTDTAAAASIESRLYEGELPIGQLKRELQNFADSRCAEAGIRVASLVVSNRLESYVALDGKSTGFHRSRPYASAWAGRDLIAGAVLGRVLCNGPNATAVIRAGEQVERIQLRGSQPADLVPLDRQRFARYRFELDSFEFGEPGPIDRRIRFYVHTKQYVAEPVAADLLLSLLTNAGARTGSVSIRNDHFFAYRGGPYASLFVDLDEPYSNHSHVVPYYHCVVEAPEKLKPSCMFRSDRDLDEEYMREARLVNPPDAVEGGPASAPGGAGRGVTRHLPEAKRK